MNERVQPSKPRRSLPLLIAVVLGLTPVMSPLVTFAQSAPASYVTVDVTDSGFSPSSVTIAAGGTVAWSNVGTGVHTATQADGQSFGMNSGGLPPYQCALNPADTSLPGCTSGPYFQFSFANPGRYLYTSATNCLFGNAAAGFDCTLATITVVSAAPPSSPVPAPSASPSAAPLPAVAAGAAVNISDTTVSPALVNVTVGGTVTWTNIGANVHTATSLGGGSNQFDTGGISPGQRASFTFGVPGTYIYSSYPDCIAVGDTRGFQCGSFLVVVTNAPPVAAAPNLPPVAGASPVAASTPLPVVAPAANTNITIDDQNGFQPQTLTVKVGQTVTWTNQGMNVHSAVSNYNQGSWYLQPAPAPFDSGGLGNGQQYSFTFTVPGTYNYKSTTELTSTNNTTAPGAAALVYQFNGVIIVGS